MANKIYLSIEIRKTKQQLVDIFNNCGLPFCIRQMILKEIQVMVDQVAEREYANDIRAMEEETEKTESKGMADSAEKGEHDDKPESTGDIEEDRGNDRSDD